MSASMSSVSEISKSESKSQSESKPVPERVIGRWRIGSTLGKGGYSWVKKGHDKKTNKIVALKFMKKADKTWAKEQTKQVVTEIECLKQVKHQNVLRLHAYNLNAKYPTTEYTKNEKTGGIEFKKIDTILLVLEYAPGGELFDILFYTYALESVLARTYFRQAIFGLEACHNAGVSHRDLKAQNLLLDSRFNLKICDFGLSKIFESDSDSVMKTTYVGTRGYQAPELLLNKPYNSSCDIFSLGVVLFILINGYPPFEQAIESDRWFNPLVSGDTKKFWKLHRQCKIRKDDKCKDMLGRMLAFDPKKRITINELKEHKWFNGKYLEGKNLIKVLRQRHKQMEIARRKDGRKLKDLEVSVKKAIKGINDETKCELYPKNEIEGINHNEQYSSEYWKDILEAFHTYIGTFKGKCKWNLESNQLDCKIGIQQGKEIKTVEFSIKVYESRYYSKSNLSKLKLAEESKENDKENTKKDTKKDDKNNDDDENKLDDNYSDDDDEEEENDDNKSKQKPKKKDVVYVVRFSKKDGETETWIKIKDDMFATCKSVITGLPEWASKYEIDDIPDEDDDDEADYSKLKNEDLWN